MLVSAKFNLKDLLLGTALISLGLAMAVTPFRALFGHAMWYHILLPQLFWLGGGAFVGGGILLPFKKAAAGAVIGFTVQVVVFYTYFIPFASLL